MDCRAAPQVLRVLGQELVYVDVRTARSPTLLVLPCDGPVRAGRRVGVPRRHIRSIERVAEEFGFVCIEDGVRSDGGVGCDGPAVCAIEARRTGQWVRIEARYVPR